MRSQRCFYRPAPGFRSVPASDQRPVCSAPPSASACWLLRFTAFSGSSSRGNCWWQAGLGSGVIIEGLALTPFRRWLGWVRFPAAWAGPALLEGGIPCSTVRKAARSTDWLRKDFHRTGWIGQRLFARAAAFGCFGSRKVRPGAAEFGPTFRAESSPLALFGAGPSFRFGASRRAQSILWRAAAVVAAACFDPSFQFGAGRKVQSVLRQAAAAVVALFGPRRACCFGRAGCWIGRLAGCFGRRRTGLKPWYYFVGIGLRWAGRLDVGG